MGLRRVLSLLSISIVATGSIVAAAPKKGAPAPKGPMAPAKDPAPAAGSGSGSAAAPAPDAAGSGSGSGSAVQMTEDAPPSDMNGTDENPDAPKGVSSDVEVVKPVAPPKKVEKYPIEEALRPINLPQNMSEISIAPHAQLGDGSAYPYAGGDALHARYGITNQVQLGFTYVFAGIYPNPMDVGSSGYNYAIHTGKALGLDVQVAITDFLSVKVGVPVYLDPVAVSIAVGAPMKFKVNEKFAFGGLDDLLNVKVSKFAPNYYQEYLNAVAAYEYSTNTVQQNGHLRFSVYGDYQLKPNLAIIGRTGIDVSLNADSSGAAGNNMGVGSGTATFLRGAIQWTPRHFIDLGFGLGFDDLGHIGSFGPQGILALRI